MTMNINTLKVGTQIAIPELPSLGPLTITHVNDSGVTVDGTKMVDGVWRPLGENYVISGSTQVQLASQKKEEKPIIKEIMNTKNEVKNAEAGAEIPASTKELKMEGSFTTKDFAARHNIPYAEALGYLKAKARVVEIRKGGRGRPSTIFTFDT